MRYGAHVRAWWKGPYGPLPASYWEDPAVMPPSNSQYRIAHYVLRTHWGDDGVDVHARPLPGPQFDLPTSHAVELRVEVLLKEYGEEIGRLLRFADRCFIAARVQLTAPDVRSRLPVNRSDTADLVVTSAGEGYEAHGLVGSEVGSEVGSAFDGGVEFVCTNLRLRARAHKLGEAKFKRDYSALYDEAWERSGAANLVAYPPAVLDLQDSNARPPLTDRLEATPPVVRPPLDWRIGTSRSVYSRYKTYFDSRRLKQEGRRLRADIQEWKSSGHTSRLAEEAIELATRPYGLGLSDHHHILKAVHIALTVEQSTSSELAPWTDWLGADPHGAATDSFAPLSARVNAWRLRRAATRAVDPKPDGDVVSDIMKQLWFAVFGQEALAGGVLTRRELQAELGRILERILAREPRPKRVIDPPPEPSPASSPAPDPFDPQPPVDRLKWSALFIARMALAREDLRLLFADEGSLGSSQARHRARLLSRYEDFCATMLRRGREEFEEEEADIDAIYVHADEWEEYRDGIQARCRRLRLDVDGHGDTGQDLADDGVGF